MLPLERLQSERASLRRAYASAKPYPHVVMDGFFDEAVLDKVAEDFSESRDRDWIRWDTVHEIKQTSRGIVDLSSFTQLLFLRLSSEPFLEHIRYITGIDDLVWDPTFKGGGLHESFRGSWLNVHADWTNHPHLPLARRLNLIIYLNRDWEEDWNGALKLYDPETKAEGASVAPLYNRAVLFPTTDKTFHGFPEAITCPPGRTRKSISIYYWSADPAALKNTTSIQFLPGNVDTRMRALARAFMPPVLIWGAGSLTRSWRRGGNK